MKANLVCKLLFFYLPFISALSNAEDLVQIYQKAVSNDPRALGAANLQEAAKQTVNEAFGQMLPQLSLQVTRGRVDQDIDQSQSTLFDPPGESEYDSKSYSLSLQQPLFNWAIYKTYRRAKSEMLQADAELLTAQQDLMLRTTERYLETLAAKDEIGFAEAEKAAVKKQLETVKAMMRGGMARRSELYDAQARYASVEADEINARSQYDDQLEALREIVGEISGELAILKPDVTLIEPNPQSPETWIKTAVEQNPRVILRLRALDVSQHQIDIDKAGHMPTLTLSASKDATDDLESSRGTDQESDQLYLNLTIPLYQGGSVNSRVQRSYQLHEKAIQDLREIKYSVQRSTRSAYNGIISAISRVSALDKSVSAQLLALEQRQKGFKSGLYTLLDVLDAEQNVYEAKRDYARARYDYLLNWLRLKHSVGLVTETDLQEINQWLQQSA